MLTPERRRDLMNLASDLKLRPFDGQLIIAIVQDAARRGEDALGHAVQERVAMVSPAVRSAERGLSPTLALATSMALGLIGMGLMIFFTVR